AALDYIREQLWQDGRLLATCKDGKAHLNAYLDDHAFLILAIMDLLQTRWNSDHLHFAISLAEAMLERFADDDNQGFFFTSHDHEKLIQRYKPWIDETLPAGNGAAARALQRLGHLIAETRYLEAADNTLKAGWASLERIPYAHGSLLCALLDHLDPPVQVILRGPAEEIRTWKREIHAPGLQPERRVYAIPDHETGLPGFLKDQGQNGQASAQICVGDRCLTPVSDLETLLESLKTYKAG
ncbi:MAG: thioredoxin domain-containing protein, partial [Gammaproteobacteria bacterium]|nr:thioredoxin domain-containing protein [Gammaproteobacteria bacterium]